MLDDILIKVGLKKEDLTQAEVDTLHQWQESLVKNELSVPAIGQYIDTMISSLERELFGYDTPETFVAFLFRRKRRRSLEARLLNYVLLRDFLRSPEKARGFVEAQLKNLASAKRVK